MANTRAGGQLRWHVDDVLTVGDQALGHMPADTVAALHRPHPLRVPAAGGEHGPVAVRIGPIAALSEDLLPPVDHLDRRRALVRIHTYDHPCHTCLLEADHDSYRRGGQRYFELGRPLLRVLR